MDGSLRVLDVQEKEASAPRPPSFPTPAPSGFPKPKPRARFASAFKQQRQAAAASASGRPVSPPLSLVAPTAPYATSASTAAGHVSDDKAGIDRENRERLRNMNPDEIEEARQELLDNLDPALLQILMRRANLDTGRNEALPTETPPEPRVDDALSAIPKKSARSKKSVSFAGEGAESEADGYNDTNDNNDKNDSTSTAKKSGDILLADVPSADGLFPISTPEAAVAKDKVATAHTHGHEHGPDHNHTSDAMHFPQTPAVPDLDPADPNFLEHLHSKYFPNLPADPARLAWMAPVPTADSAADRESPYYPGQATVAVSQLRFDFQGRLVPPRRSRTIPVSKGLHHHGEAPEAAGYTVGELARLARSAVPAQRCVAFQILGRLLFRLGRGEWGTSSADIDKDPRSAVGQGIWRCVQQNRVLETLREAAGVEEGSGHRGSRAYAIEAVWLFEKGGWKEAWKGR